MKTFKRFMGEAYSRSEKRSHSKPPKSPPVPMPMKNHYRQRPGDVKYNMPIIADPDNRHRAPRSKRDDIGTQYKYNPTDNYKLKV